MPQQWAGLAYPQLGEEGLFVCGPLLAHSAVSPVLALVSSPLGKVLAAAVAAVVAAVVAVAAAAAAAAE
jgi:hypothetical protein